MEITLDAIRAAAERLRGVAVRTPLVALGGDQASDIWLKPEVLQPIGSFKLRGAYNAIAARRERYALQEISTVSAGNMSQAVAWSAHRSGLPSRAWMPDVAPEFKVNATRDLGAQIAFAPLAEIMTMMGDGRFDADPGFIHPFNDPYVAAGNGTIGLEILDDLPEVETVIVPVGGGGLLLGILSALMALRPEVRVWGVQPEARAGLAASLAAGEVRSVEMGPTISDGAGSPYAMGTSFPIFQQFLKGCFTISEDETRAAIYRLATRNKLVAEGAGALAVAAALRLTPEERGRTVCVVSGGSINPSLLAEILAEQQQAG
jgi:threonine dehydratase